MTEEKKIGKLFIISGPSGAGKTTLVKEALKRLSNAYPLKRVTTYTCRTPRPGELNGKDYYFVSPDEFEQKRREGFFLETTTLLNNPYASPASLCDDLARGENRIIVVDREGAKELAKIIKDPVLIWITAPSIDILKHRIKKRSQISEEKVEKRIAVACEEMHEEEKQPFFKYHLYNDEHEFDRAVSELVLLIENELGVK